MSAMLEKNKKNPEAQIVTVQISNRKQCNSQKNMYYRNQRTNTLFFYDLRITTTKELKQYFNKFKEQNHLRLLPSLEFYLQNKIEYKNGNSRLLQLLHQNWKIKMLKTGKIKLQ